MMRITSPTVQDALIRSLADDYGRRIMLGTMETARSVDDLSQTENIPISTAYRRVNEMKEVGILTVEKTILTDDGKKYPLYRSAFKAVHMDLSRMEILIDVELNQDVATRLAKLWAAMRA